MITDSASGIAVGQTAAPVSRKLASPAAPNEFQAEEGVLSSAYVRTEYAGYTGAGYVDIANKTGASLEILFRRATAVPDTVRITYALGGSTRAYAVSLNGSSLGTLSFTGTGSWTAWSTVSMVIVLQAGVNRLNFAATTNTSDNANIDKILIGGQSATAVFRLTLAKSGPGSVAASPPSADSVYDAGTTVTLTASPPPAFILHHWSGTEESSTNPLVLTMDSHTTEIAVVTPPAGFGAFPYQSSADGFASVDALGYPEGTTGGTGPGSQLVYVTNYTDVASLMLRRADPAHLFNFPPLIVYVIGTIAGTGMIDVKDVYDLSIIGAGIDAKLSGCGLYIQRSRNVIVRNLLIENSTVDGITVQGNDVEGTCDHIWIDHCSVTNAFDGAIDVTHTASYVTLSWNHLYQHNKTSLMGHSDTQTSDVAMKVTYHHNFFDSTVQRHPRVRFGKAHVYNNYFRKNGIYGVSSNLEADVVVEASYFLDVPIPAETSRDASPPGDLVERYNIFAGTTGEPGTRGTAFDPSAYYSYALDSAVTIPAMLSAYAGSGRFDFSSSAILPPVYTLSLSAPHGTVLKNPDKAAYDSGSTVQLTATPDTGYHFVSWSGDLTGSSNPVDVAMYSSKNVTANFSLNQYALNITVIGNGSVAKNPEQLLYDHGANVMLIPAAQAEWVFDGWSGDASGSANPLPVTMTDVRNITATFVAGEHVYELNDKWNLISLHVSVADARTTSIFPTAISGAYAYESVYTIRDTLEPGVGYWIKFYGAQNNGIAGTAIHLDTAELSVGWNMIGSVTDSAVVGTAQVQEIPPGIVTSHFFGYNGIYVSATAIREGKAYWVKANAPGKIVLNSSLAAGLPQARFSDSPDPLREFSRLTITDAAGNAQTLYLGNSRSRVEPSEYELPPVPPSSLFDARFGSQRYVEVYEAKSQKEVRYALSLQSAVLPLTVKWEMRDNSKIFAVVDEKSGKCIALQGTGSTVLGTSTNSLAVTVDDWREIPVEFSLGPNYPNPFNPTTSFVVGLPQSAPLSVGVYNMVGQKVRTLIDEVRPGGYFTVQWDGTTDDHQVAGSGVYFVRMASQSFSAVRKIVMLR